jgi:hemoglobin/transferrin/lactoferrin receptor protein
MSKNKFAMQLSHMKKIIIFIYLLGFITTLQAQDTLSVNLHTTVISATRTAQSRTAVAQSVQVIPQVTIERLNAQTTADLLQNNGGVFVQRSQQGGGSPVLRGFEASRILLVVDGVRMNNAIYRAGHLQNIITVDNNLLERAEVLFGPSSSVYGSDALGGAICLFTKQPTLSKTAGSVNIDLGGFIRYSTVNQEKSTNINFNIGGHKLAALTSFTYNDFGDLKMGKKKGSTPLFGLRNQYVERVNGKDSLFNNADPYLQKNTGYKQYNVLEKIVYKQSDNVEHTLNIQWTTSTNIPRYDRLTDPGSNGVGLRFAEWYYGPQKRAMASYQFSIKEKGWFNNGIKAILSAQDIEESRVSRRFNNNAQKNQIEKVQVLGATVYGVHQNKDNTTQIGIDAQHNIVSSEAFNMNIADNTSTPTGTRYPDGGSRMSDIAAFAAFTQNKGNFIFNQGARAGFSSMKATFEDRTLFPFPFSEVQQNSPLLSGNLGAIWLPSTKWRWVASASTGFRMPNVDDSGKVFESQKGSLIVPNPDLKPEQTFNLEFGWTYQHSKNIKWETSIWNTIFRNALVTDQFQYNGQDSVVYDGVLSRVLANQNKRRANIAGITSSIDFRIANHIMGYASGTYTYGRILQDEGGDTPLDHIPPFFGKAGVRYNAQRLDLELFSLFNGKKPINQYFLNGEDNEQYAPANGMPSWFTINVRGGYKIGKVLTVQVGVDNILDTQYRVFASGINAPGRNFFITLRI